MAIDEGDLKLEFGNTSITRSTMTLQWRVTAGGETVESGSVSLPVAKPAQMINDDKELRARAQSEYISVVAFHKPRPAYSNLSVFDADLVLDRWWQSSTSLVHDLSGIISNAPDGIEARVMRIIEVCAPPPTWAWAESVVAGQLRVKCAAVAGADSYNVYDDDGETFTLLGNVASAGWNALSVDAGTYNVRQGAVIDGRVGILWKPIEVTVS
jgi:hypothetical protein